MANNPLRSRSTTSQPSNRSRASDVDRRRAVRNAPANPRGINTAFGTRPVTPLEDLDLAPHRLFGRFITQGIKSVDPILRGLYSIGKSAYQGLEKPLFSGMQAAGLDVGSYGERVLETESMGPELAKEFAKSVFLETPSALADLSYVPNLIFSGPEAARARLGGRLQELSDEPFMFGLEHVGNAAIVGATAAKPLQLGIASSRGALTPAAARGGMMPVTGRGARVTARHATRQAAEEGSRVAKTAEFLDDVVGHPYIAAGRRLRGSYPGQLIRNPMPRERMFSRISAGLRGRMDELIQGEEGSLNFRKGDPRREYNDLYMEIARLNNRMAGYPEGHPVRVEAAMQRARKEIRQNQLRRELQSRGIEFNEYDFISVEGVDPADLVAERDFTFDEGGGTFSADGFWQSMSGPLRRKMMRDGKKLEPNIVDFEPHILSTLEEPSADFYKTNAEGEIVGVLTVYPDDIHVAVNPAYRRQGIAKQMVERAIEAGVPLERIVTNPHSQVSTSQYGTILLEWGRKAFVENPGRFRNKGVDPRFDQASGIDSFGDQELGLMEAFSEADELDDLRRTMPGASDAEVLRAYQRSQDIAEGRAPRDFTPSPEDAELYAELERRLPHLSSYELNRLLDELGDAALDVITEEMGPPNLPRDAEPLPPVTDEQLLDPNFEPPPGLDDILNRANQPAQARPQEALREITNPDRPDMPIEVMESGSFRNPRTGEFFDTHSEAMDSVYREEGLTNPLAPENNRVTASTRQLRNMGVDVFELARARPDFAERRAAVVEALDEGLIEPEVRIRVRPTSDGRLAFQLDDGTHRFFAAEDGLLRDELIVNFVTDSYGTPATGRLLQRAREAFSSWSEDAVTGTRAAADNRGPVTNDAVPPQSQEAIAGRELLNALGDLLRSEEGSIALFGPGRQKLGNRIGLIDLSANEIGLALQRIKESPGFERAFGPDAKMSRFIRSDFIKSVTHGDGTIANQLEELISEQVGNRNLQRRWDPARTEQLFMRDLDNLAKRPDAPKYADLIADFRNDRPTLRTAPKRAGEVLIGSESLGQYHTPEVLVRRVDRVLEYAREASNGDQALLDATLRDLLPGVEPMGMYLMALNGIERLKGLPDNSLTGALGDYVTMDRFGELNRRAQQALGDKAAAVTGERFSLPPEALGVDLTTLPAEHQRLFHEAAAQYRQELGRQREPLLLEEGVIRSRAGSRAGLAANEPTRFSSELDDLPLDPSTRSRVETTRKAVEEQQIRLSAARQEHMAREQARLDAGMKLLDDLESSVLTDPANAPVAARNLLVYANEVAPRQAQALRQMAEEGVGDPKVLEGLAQELEAMPKTLEDLNDADVYLAYLKDIKDVGRTEPTGIGVRQGINTRNPARRRGTATDIEYSRDFRSRAYWQDSEFQSYFMSRQADELVKREGLALTGRERLREAGWSDEAIDKLSTNRVQQELERLRLRTYDPSKLFPSGRKPPQGIDPLDARWIHPWVENNLLTAIKEPSNFERILQGTYDPLLKGWKVFALPLRFAWQVNNYAGSSMLTMLHGKVSPMDYASLMRASYKAVQDYNRGIPSQISFPLKDSYKAELVAKLNTLDAADPQRAMIQKMLDEGRINLTNEVLGDIAQNGLLRGDFAFLRNSQFAKDIGARPKSIFKQYGVDLTLPENLGGETLRLGSRVRNLKKSGRQIVDFSYHVNSTVDNMHRTMIYLDQIGKGSSPEQALSQIAKTLGDYSKLSPFERTWVKRIYPFWPWMRHITSVVASAFKPQNMTRAVIFAHIMSIFGEPNEWEEMLPDYAQGHIFMGLDENGKPKFLSTRGLNPFLDVFDPVGQPNLQGLIRPMAPPFQYLYEKLSGTSVLTGRPISSPSGDPEARPPLSEYFFRNIPQAGVARDIYRDLTDQPLTRYGTGEPAFFQGTTERSGADSVRQMLGLNVRSIDVESQQNAERVREYNQEVRRRRHEAQKNSQGGRSLTDLLDSLPGLGGGQSGGSSGNPLR